MRRAWTRPAGSEHATTSGSPREVTSRARFVTRVVIIVVAACFVLAAPSIIFAAIKGRAGRTAMVAALEALKAQDGDRARESLSHAERDLGAAADSLGSIWTLPARLIPLAGRQLSAARSIARAGALTAQAGSGAAEAMRAQPAGGWGLRQGAIDIRALEAAGRSFRISIQPAESALTEIKGAPRRWLVPPLGNWRSQAESEIERASSAVRKAAAGLAATPELLGGNGARRYLVMNSNLTEQRGSGGFLGYFSVLNADNGKMTLGASGRPTVGLPPLREATLSVPDWFQQAWGPYGALDMWQNINMSTDFPTVAQLITDAVQASPGPIDGVIQVDPYGLAALVKLTGPVSVPAWPEPIDADNLPRISQFEVYKHYGDTGGWHEFGEQLSGAVFDSFVSADLDLSAAQLETLGAAVADGHVKMYSRHPEAQKALKDLEMDGGLQRFETADDVLGTFYENASGTKLEWFLHKDVIYDLTVDPQSGNAQAELRIAVRNEAPTSGLPRYIIGPNEAVFRAGENVTLVVVLRPPDSTLLGLTVDGRPQTPLTGFERSLRAYQVPVDVDSGKTVRVLAKFLLRDVVRDGAIDFRFVHQTVINPDRLRVRVHTPVRWSVRGAPDGPIEVHRDLEHRFEFRRSIAGLLALPIDFVGSAFRRLF